LRLRGSVALPVRYMRLRGSVALPVSRPRLRKVWTQICGIHGLMDEEKNYPQRKHPAHGVLRVATQSTIVMVTACTKGRVACLANDAVHGALCRVWQEATGWLVGRYIVMPEHTHFFAAPGTMDIRLERWSAYWKSQLTKALPSFDIDWLPQHWDTRIRSAAHYEQTWEYLRNNPVRRGLVATPDDWPYQGVIHDLEWSG
jgi:putative transposase